MLAHIGENLMIDTINNSTNTVEGIFHCIQGPPVLRTFD